VWELKTQILRKSGSLELHRGQEDFQNLGGLASLKSFCRRAMRRRDAENGVQRSRGVLLLSPPGCGKSQFCKALGREVDRPVLILDVGSLMGSLVGSVRRANTAGTARDRRHGSVCGDDR
jgi:SpoVK/Ycf46/Vps4 family AAA+-type ATPase